jgi:DNA-binding MarR family transcriptional regulator
MEAMETTIDPAKMTLWRCLQWAHTVVLRSLEREMEAEGLPLTWFDVLIHLHEAPDGRLRMLDLAGSVVLSPSGLTRLVERMEKAGYVRRERTEVDRRGAYAIITPKGDAELARVWPAHLDGIERHFARNVRSADVPRLYEALARIITAVEGPDSWYAARPKL